MTKKLVERIADGFARVREQFNSINPRLMPAGGKAGAMLAKVTANDNAVDWVSPPYGFTFICAGKPEAGEKFGPYVADRAFVLSKSFASCIAKAGVAAGASSAWTLSSDGIPVATITFAANAALGEFSSITGTDVSVTRGSMIFLSAPKNQDATLADIGFTLVGTR